MARHKNVLATLHTLESFAKWLPERNTEIVRTDLFIERMNASGVAYLQGLVDQLSDDEIAMVAHIFSRTNDIFESYPGPFRA